MKVTSSAALAVLTISKGDLETDPSLQWIVQATNPLQLKVETTKNAPMKLEFVGGVALTQRNSIVRSLCGMGLQNSLDRAPYYCMGGHAAAVGASPQHAVAIASISSWMSVADSARVAVDPDLLTQLNAHLGTRAFLVPSFQCTIADVDVAMVLLKIWKDNIPSFPNIHRWFLSVASTLIAQGVKFPSMDPTLEPSLSPLFFYGTEQISVPQPPRPTSDSWQHATKKEQKKAEEKKPQEKDQKPQKEGQVQQPADSFDISALDIRVGKIIKAWHHPESDKLFCEEIDIGEEGPRQIASGLRPFYQVSDLEGRRVVVLCNLKSRNLGGFQSHGMVLCASNADHTCVEFIDPPPNAKIGERVCFEGFKGEPEPPNKIAKKKIFESLAPNLKTDSNGVCIWKGALSQTTDGPIRASKGMPNAHVS